jgi:SMC interacting uncharacterized protein involved in chromosome segregation
MLFKKDRKIKNQEAMIKNRDILIGDMEKQAEVLNEENKELRFELEKKDILINKLEKLVDSNKYSNEKVFTEKIKELVHDYQSLN